MIDEAVRCCVVRALGGFYAMQSAEMQTMRYSHRTADQEQFSRDKYACLQETQQPYSVGGVSGFAGAGSANVVGASRGGVRTDWDLFTACMHARGYREDSRGRLAG